MRVTCERIGAVIGEFMEIEAGDDGRAVGQYLTVRVWMDIRKPIMWGIKIQLGENMHPKWCPFEYEFLPDFCFTCGIIGHLDRRCALKLKRGEKWQYGKWVKVQMSMNF